MASATSTSEIFGTLQPSRLFGAWPASAGGLSFGYIFRSRFNNISFGNVSWPSSLPKLTVWGVEVTPLDQPVDTVTLPPGLLRLEFPNTYNEPIAGIVWPSSLREVKFGEHFNQPIAGVVWPPSVEVLGVGGTGSFF